MHKYSTEKIQRLRGSGVALVTPFQKNAEIDFQALQRLIDHVINGGIDYVVSMGTTGESVTLSEAERFEIIKKTVDYVDGRVPVVAGFGGNNTAELIRSINRFDFTGIDAILSASPYYNKPTQEGIYQHYMAIDAICPVPIILYNVPGRTSSNIEAKTTIRLAEDSNNIVAVKEASGNLVQMMHIANGTPDTFLLISGDDAITLPILSIGGSGVISVIANAYPSLFSNMVNFGLNNDVKSAKEPHYKLLSITEAIFKEGNPAGVKYILQMMGIMNDTVRLPLAPISKNLKEEITREMEKI